MCKLCSEPEAKYKTVRDTLPDEIRHYRVNRKDTKRWCKGKEGREHAPAIIKRGSGYLVGMECQVVSWSPDRWLCVHAKVCSICKKVLDWGVECPDKPSD